MEQKIKYLALATSLQAARGRKSVDNGKAYSLRRVSQDAGVDYGHIHRVFHGHSLPSREVLVKICDAMGCSAQERVEIFHSVGYLTPEEMPDDEDRPAA